MSWKDKFRAAEREREGKNNEEEYEGTLYAYYKGMKWWKTVGEGFKILVKTYLPTLLITISVMFVFAVIATLALTEWRWGVAEKTFPLLELIEKNPANFADWPQADQDLYNQLFPIYQKASNRLNFVNLFINFFPLGIIGVISGYYILETAKGNKIKLIDAIKYTFRTERVGITVLTMLILSVLISAGFTFYFIPGIIMLIMVGLCIPTLVDTNKSLKDVLNDGFKMGKDFRLRTTILVIISVAFFSFFGNYLAQLFFSARWVESTRLSWLDPATRNWWMLLYVDIMNFLTTAVFIPILFAFLSVHYLELGVQKEVEWFDYTPLTKKKVSEFETRDIFPNAAIFGLLTVISLVLSIVGVIDYLKARFGI